MHDFLESIFEHQIAGSVIETCIKVELRMRFNKLLFIYC